MGKRLAPKAFGFDSCPTVRPIPPSRPRPTPAPRPEGGISERSVDRPTPLRNGVTVRLESQWFLLQLATPEFLAIAKWRKLAPARRSATPATKRLRRPRLRRAGA